MRVLIVIAGCGALLAACERRSDKYCMLHPTDLAFCERSDAPSDAPMMCTSNAECSAADPYCEPSAHICVECLTSADCATHPGEPQCNPTTFACQGCLVHTDCASGACLPEGTCGDESNVIYVSDQGLDTNPCTAAAPCKTIAHAITLLTQTRQYIKLSGALVESATILAKRATFLADPGTTLTGTADPTLKLQKSELRIYDLAVTCPAAPAIGGIKSEMESTTTLVNVTIRGCGHKGLEGKGGYLRVNRSTVAQNLEGGIVLDGMADFSITNTFIYLNGKPDVVAGGVMIGATTSGINQFEFNTVVQNIGKVVGGVTCPTTNGMPAKNNLIVENSPANTVGCDFSASIVAPDITPYDFLGANNYHLGANSEAIDKVTATSSVSDDVDAQYRPIGAAKDFGADEYKP